MRPWKTLVLLALVVAVAGVLAGPATAEIDPDLLAGLKARNIGPAGMSGRVTSIEGVAQNPDLLYVGAASGGVWKSTNGGLTFRPIFDDQPVHSIGSIAIYPPQPDIVWVGTGEGNVRNSASFGEGVFKSMDGGKTWQRSGLEKTERIGRIALHPSNPDVAFACALGQEWGENPDRGVFRTDDGGKTWKKVLYVDEKTGCGELQMDPANPEHLLAGMWQFRRWPYVFKSGGPGSGLFITWDGGATWKKEQEEDGLPAGELGRMGIAFSRSSPEIVYALVEAKKSALLRSSDGGRSWSKMNTEPNVAPRPFYFSNLRVDPAWPSRVYRLGYGIDVSEDSGKTFKPLHGARQIHGDFHEMWIAPDDPRRVVTGDDGGVSISDDRGESFRFVANLPLAQFYHVQLDDDWPYHAYGGLQDNGSWRGPVLTFSESGITNHLWTFVGGGDGFETIPIPGDSNQGYAESQGGELVRWNAKTGEQRFVKPTPPAGVKLRFNWNAGLAVDPFDASTVYLGSQFVHKSTDRGESWTTISPDLTTNNPDWQKADESGGITPDNSRAEQYTTIIAIAPSPVERGLIWVGTDDGRVQVTRDGGKNWTSVEKNVPGVPANTWVPHIKASRYDAGTAFVVFDNHRRSDLKPYVYRTTDYGKTWVSLGAPNLRGYCLAIEQDPVEKNLLFLGTEFGLYVSLDEGRTWTAMKHTLPTASVMDLAIHPQRHDLVIATHGRALWVLDDIRPLRALSAATLAEPLHLYAASPGQEYWRKLADGGFGLGAAEFRGENRQYGVILTYSLNLPDLPVQDEEKERARKEKKREDERAAAMKKESEKGKAPEAAKKEEAKKEEPPEKVEITITDAAGKVMRSMKGPAKLGVNRAVWNFGSDAWKELPRARRRGGDDEERSGPEVPPGTYTVTVKFAGHEARQAIEVDADPRSKNTAADWQTRWAAIEQGKALFDTLADAVWRVRHTRDDVEAIEAKAKQAAKDAGEKDPKKLDELPLVKAAGKVLDQLKDVEKRLWQSPEAVGIQPDIDVMSDVFNAAYGVQGSWDPPSPTHREYMRIARERVSAVVGEVNKLMDGDVAAFRKQAEDAKIGFLPAAAPLAVPPGS